ncbi:MAG: hypothetical protein EAZ57_02170 [Cytophagales bacterium]|nr:MAG: hypothetical protein EAZ67_02415 [Cytophagales bacterium]TAF61927.1 MAG: hypothetical protein EAZ57_02170 [Cytophagales bacterium]
MQKREKYLREQLENASDVNSQIEAFFWLSWHLLTNGSMQDFFDILEPYKSLVYKHNHQRGIAMSMLQEGLVYNFGGDIKKAFPLFLEAERILTEINDRGGLGVAYGRLGSAYWSFGDHQKAFDYTLKSIELCQEYGIDLAQGWACYLLAGYYYDLKDYDSSEIRFLEALAIFEKNEEFAGVPRCINGLADVFHKRGNQQQALLYNQKAYDMLKDINGSPNSLSRVYNDFGKIYRSLNQLDLALEYYKKSLDIRLELNYKQGIITTYTEMGELYLQNNDPATAIDLFLNAVQLAEETNAKVKLINAHKNLVEAYKASQEPWKALEHYDIYLDFREQVMGDESTMKINNFKMLYEAEQSKQEAEIYRLKNTELKAAYDEIEQKNKDITASIAYAQRIQKAVLPPREEFNNIVPQGFILFRPKDIVSGDFYWFFEEGDYVIVVLADCTGHGVPGAFMTMMGNDMLNDIVIERSIFSPAQILTLLDKRLRDTLKQNTSASDMHDTIDVSVVCINKKAKSISFAGARQSMYFFHKGEMLKVRGSKFHVGGDQFNENKAFDEHVFQYETNDMVFLNSDGYPDQFHGVTKEKFKSRRLASLYREISQEPTSEQENTLVQSLDNWKLSGKQTDDILVIGMRLCDYFNIHTTSKERIFA